MSDHEYSAPLKMEPRRPRKKKDSRAGSSKKNIQESKIDDNGYSRPIKLKEDVAGEDHEYSEPIKSKDIHLEEAAEDHEYSQPIKFEAGAADGYSVPIGHKPKTPRPVSGNEDTIYSEPSKATELEALPGNSSAQAPKIATVIPSPRNSSNPPDAHFMKNESHGIEDNVDFSLYNTVGDVGKSYELPGRNDFGIEDAKKEERKKRFCDRKWLLIGGCVAMAILFLLLLVITVMLISVVRNQSDDIRRLQEDVSRFRTAIYGDSMRPSDDSLEENSVTGKIAQLEKSFADLSQNVSRINLEDIDDRTFGLEIRMDKMNVSLTATESDLLAASNKAENLTVFTEKLGHTLENLTSSLQHQENVISKQEQRFNSLSQEASDIRNATEQLDTKLEGLRQSVEDMNQTAESVRREMKEFRSEVETIQKGLNESVHEAVSEVFGPQLSAIREEMEKINETLTSTVTEQDEIKEKVGGIQGNLTTVFAAMANQNQSLLNLIEGFTNLTIANDALALITSNQYTVVFQRIVGLEHEMRTHNHSIAKIPPTGPVNRGCDSNTIEFCYAASLLTED